MHRIVSCMLATVVAGLLWSGLVSAKELPSPVEEWQIRGILAALKDGHSEVGRRAASKLATLLEPGTIDQKLIRFPKDSDEEANREWKGNSRLLAKEATPHLLRLLKDKDFETRDDAVRALGGLEAKEAL